MANWTEIRQWFEVPGMREKLSLAEIKELSPDEKQEIKMLVTEAIESEKEN